MGKYTIAERKLKQASSPDGDPAKDAYFTGMNIPLLGKRINVGTFDSDATLHFQNVGASDGYKMDCWLFEVKENVVPNWFGVAVPHTVREFSRPHVFFHPMPSAAKLPDSVYRQKELDPGWVNIYRYVRICGMQLALSGRKQIFILPFFTTAAADTLGVFAADWKDMLTDILGQLNSHYAKDVLAQKRAQAGATGKEDLGDYNNSGAFSAELTAQLDASRNAQITDLTISSFSAGIRYLHTFVKNAANATNYLREIFDFDGRGSDYANLCQSIVRTPQHRVLRYDQRAFAPGQVTPDEFHVPLARWGECPPTLGNTVPPKTMKDVHSLIPAYMFYHAWMKSSVGT